MWTEELDEIIDKLDKIKREMKQHICYKCFDKQCEVCLIDQALQDLNVAITRLYNIISILLLATTDFVVLEVRGDE